MNQSKKTALSMIIGFILLTLITGLYTVDTDVIYCRYGRGNRY